jgi:hypothetical protein
VILRAFLLRIWMLSLENRALMSRLEQKAMEIVRKGSEEKRLVWQRHAREERTRIEKVLQSGGLAKTAINIKDRIKRVLEGSYGHGALTYAEAYFRNKEGVSENDLETLLEDLEDLDLLEEAGEEKG